MRKLRHIDWPYQFELLSIQCDPDIRAFGIEVGTLEGSHWERSLFAIHGEPGRVFLDLCWLRVLTV